MRKIQFSLMTLVLGLVAVFAWASGSSSSQSYNVEDQSIDLSDCYNFLADPSKVAYVHYKTKTQSGIVAPKVATTDGKAIYYIASTLEPVTITVQPKTGYGVKHMESDTKKFATYPELTTTYASAFTLGEVNRVDILPLAEVRNGEWRITCDDPSKIVIESRNGQLRRKFTGDDFSGNSLVVNYDPQSETTWVVGKSGYGTFYRGNLNGENLTRQQVTIAKDASTYELLSGYTIELSGADNSFDAKVDFPDFDVPVKITMCNAGGNETNQAYLDKAITKVSAGGAQVENWNDFTVKNGSNIYVYNATGISLKNATINGKKADSSRTFLVDLDSPEELDICIYAKIDNPWRYNLNVPKNYDKFEFSAYYSPVELTSATTSGTAGSGVQGHVDIKTLPNGYYVSGVKVNGQAVAPVALGRYSIDFDKQDTEIEVAVDKYERNKTMTLNVNLGRTYPCGTEIRLAPETPLENRVAIVDGINTIKYNDLDLPIKFDIATPDIYIGTQQQTSDNYGYYLANYQQGQVVKVFGDRVSLVSVTYTGFPSGVNATVTHDGVAVANPSGKTFNVLPGTEIKVTPTSGSNLVLEHGLGNFIQKTADGAFTTYVPKYSATYSLHPQNPQVTVISDIALLATDQDYNCYNVAAGTNILFFPYSESAATYSVKFTDETKGYSVANVTSSPSGATFDTTTGRVSGVKDGMTLNVTTEKLERPYEVRFKVVVPDNVKWIDLDENGYVASGYYIVDEYGDPVRDYNGNATRCMTTMRYFYTDNSYEWGDGTMSIPLQFGEVNKETYSFNEGLLLGAENFPVYLFAGEAWGNSSIGVGTVVINGLGYTAGNEDNKIIIDEPQNLNITVYPYTVKSLPLSITSDTNDFKYSINGGAPKAGSVGKFYLDVFPGCELTIYPGTSGLEGATMKVNGKNITPTQVDGAYVFKTDDNNSSSIDVTVSGKQMTLQVSSDNSAAGVKIEGSTTNGNNVSVAESSEVKVNVNPGYEVTEVVDLNTGKILNFDPETGIVSGVEPGMNLSVSVQEYKRELVLKVITPTSTPKMKTAPTLTLAKGTNQEKVITLSSSGTTTVNYNPKDAPFYIDPTKAVFRPSYTDYQSQLYINDVEIPYDSQYGYQMPDNVADGSVLRFVNVNPTTSSQTATCNLTYVIDPDVKVNILHDGRPVEAASKTMVIPTSTVITVEAAQDNEYELVRTYNVGSGNQDFTTTYSVPNTAKTLTISVAKKMNTLTFNGSDLETIEVTAGEQKFNLSATNNLLEFPTNVKELTVVTNKPDHFIASIESTASGMTFNPETGKLTGLATATLTPVIKAIERENEVTVYLDNEELSAGALVLGNGKVIENNAEIGEGYTTVNFSEEDLPIIYKVDSSTLAEAIDEAGNVVDESKLPTVYVNGEALEYSVEHGGYVFPIEALTSGEAPVIKIYAPQPTPVAPMMVTYLVEPGITFTAIEDGVTEVAEASTRQLLPGTEISLTAAADNGDAIYVEVAGQRVAAQDGKYTFNVSSDLTIEVKREKLHLSINGGDEWKHVQIAGSGLNYPMYDQVSDLQFPYSTKELRFTSSAENRMITAIKDENGNALPYNSSTGILTGFNSAKSLTVEFGDYLREISLDIYVDEEEASVSHIILAQGTAVEKVIALKKGYNTIAIANADLPLALKAAEGLDTPAVVYLNNEELQYNAETATYEFPGEIEENSIVKVFAQTQPTATLFYNVQLQNYEIKVWHDRQQTVEVDLSQSHHLLPGTEINFTLAAAKQAQTKAFNPKAKVAQQPVVTVNEVEVDPDENGIYTVKVNDDHITNGLHIAVVEPQSTEDDEEGDTAGIDQVNGDDSQAVADVYSLQGVLIKKAATQAQINALPAGFYIIGGQKMAVK